MPRTIHRPSRCLALLLALALVLPRLVLAADTQTADQFSQVTTAYLDSAGGAYNMMTISSYLSDLGTETKSVQSCDIIFVLDQSKWMNGTQGTERAAILKAMDTILEDLEPPTDGGEHRVAIAGYGRVNVNQQLDSYNATEYPGVQHKGSGISLNTGYYTASGFQSQSGWTEVKDSSSSALPTMPSGYQAAMTYDSTFMTVAEAENVIDPDTMLAWYSGASRMDAGLTLAEQLADLANANDPDQSRNLIVCVVASSIPIQNYNSWNCIRDSAVLAAAENLKAQGATIFALGDYHNAGKNLAADTEAHFSEVMSSVCGSTDTPEEDKEDYFFSMSTYGSATEALNRMCTQITVTVANSTVQNATVIVDSVYDFRSDPTNDWKEWLQDIYAKDPDTQVNIAYYAFTGWEYGEPAFAWEPYEQEDTTLQALLQPDGTLAYTARLIPVQDTACVADGSPAQGNQVVITISNPVTIVHQWAEDGADYAPGDVTLPVDAHVALGAGYVPEDLETTDPHYAFAGWYTDAACQDLVAGAISPGKRGLVLYGKWTRYALVNFYAQAPDIEDESTWVKLGETLESPTLQRDGYTFAGWYTDPEGTTAYDFSQPITADLDLYAQWTPNTYQVQFDGNGEGTTGTMEDQIFSYDVAQNLTTNTFQREGYTFAGWNTQPEGNGTGYTDGQRVRNLTTEQGGTVTLYAQWAIHTYTIRVGVTDGTADPSAATLTVSHGDSQTITFTPNPGYALDTVTVDGESACLNDDGSYTFQNVTADHQIAVVYAPDSNGDSIPDQYQVFVQFRSWDDSLGTVTGIGCDQVYPLLDRSGKYTSAGDVTPTLTGVTVTALEGYTFIGWTLEDAAVDPTATLENIPGGTTLTFYAQWTAAPAPVTPTVAVYQVLHYQEQLDGTYTLVETEAPLYGDIGETVTATPRAYDHYHVNTEKSTLSGTVTLPTVEDGSAVTLLTLQVYYDLDTVTLTYDLDGGAAEETDYPAETVKYGATVTLGPEPTRVSYAFTGWQVDGQTYAPGDTLTLTQDTQALALWTFHLVPPTGLHTDLAPWTLMALLCLLSLAALALGRHHPRRRPR